MTMKRVTPGEPWKPSASRENRVADAVEAIERIQRRLTGGSLTLAFDSNSTIAKNTDSTDIPMFGVVEVTGTVFVPSENVPGFQSQPAVTVRVPTSSTAGRFGIALEPIAAGSLGRVAFDGLVVAQVEITDPAVTFAREKVGSATELETSTTGTARIIARESASSGTVWALLQLGPGGGSGGDQLFLVDPTNTTSVGGSSPPQWYYHLLPAEINAATGVLTAISGATAAKGWNLWEDQDNYGHGQPLTTSSGATITPSKVLGPVHAKPTGLTNGGYDIYTFDVPCPADSECAA